MIDFYETPGDWKSPNWDECDRIHDWKNYISDKMRAIWDTFTDEQKQAIAESAQGAANSEQWD